MNIYDVAKLSGVSIATVSRVMNKKPGVSDQAKAKVLRVIEQTEYRPNQLAKSLTNNKTNVIGIVMPNVNDYFRDRIDAINKVCKKHGYSLMITANYKEQNDIEEDISNFNLLYEKRVDGIIYFPITIFEEHIQHLKKLIKSVPVVITDNEIPLDIPTVLQDTKSASLEIMKYLIEGGHEKIAFISGLYFGASNKQFKAYQLSLKKYGLVFNEAYVAHGDCSVKSGYAAMTEIIKRVDELPTAVYASNDNMAVGAINALKDNGISVPEQISVFGYDDIDISKYFIPSLSTIHVNQYEIGKMAAKMLIERIKNKNAKVRKIAVDFKLIVRNSVKKINDSK